MIRTAILGLGNVAERIHLPACRAVPEVFVIAASELDEGRRSRMQSQFAIPEVFADSKSLLERVRPELVIVGTPPDSHAALCRLAFDYGADVLCEKPFATSVEEADEVLAAARSAGRRLAVNTQYRYMAIYRKTMESLRRGDFGRPFAIQCWQQMFHPPQFEKLAWRAALRRSTLFEFGSHALDLVCKSFDDLPLRVSAELPAARPEYDADVVASLLLRFPGERVATLNFNRVSHAPERYFEMRIDCEDASVRISLGGVARLAIDLARSPAGRRLRWRTGFVQGGEARVEAGGRSWVLAREPQMAFASATAAHLRSFLATRGEGEPDLAEAAHAREILRLVFTAYAAAEAGRTLAFRAPDSDRAV
jgi:predicted dehydrogenase